MIICKPTFTSPLVRIKHLNYKKSCKQFFTIKLGLAMSKNILWALKTTEIEFLHLSFEYSRIYSEILITIPNS